MKRYRSVASILLLSLVLIGCGGGSGRSTTPDADTGTPVDDGSGGELLPDAVYVDDGEAPVFTSSKTISVMEKTNEVMMVTAEDASLVLYKIVNVDTWGQYFDIDPLTGELAFKEGSEPDYAIAREYYLTISAMDLSRRETIQEITITILDDSETGSDGTNKSEDTVPPEFVSSNMADVPENSHDSFHTIVVADVSSVTLSIENLDTWGQYFEFVNVTSNSAELSLKEGSEADHEISREYFVTLKATDENGNESLQELTVMVLDEYEDRAKPRFISYQIANVMENQRSAITVVTSDESPVTYSITNLDTWGQYFDIAETIGVVTFKEAFVPDYEGTRVYYPTVKATDSWGNEATQDITIYIMNEAEDDGRAPVFVSPSLVSVMENRKVITTLEATDSTSVTYALQDPSRETPTGRGFPEGRYIDVSSSTGVVSFQDGEEPDYEEGLTEFSFVVKATDTWENIGLQTLTVQVLDESIIHDGIEYESVISPNTGQIWLDRNLGASRACITADDAECYGGHYQWGRNSDGHQRSTSSWSFSNNVTYDDVGHDRFIISYLLFRGERDNYDWTGSDASGTRREARWSSVDGSSVCPVGFRVPYEAELQRERPFITSLIRDPQDAFNSFLRLPSNGYRQELMIIADDGVYSDPFGQVGEVTTLWLVNKSDDFNARSLRIFPDEFRLSPENRKFSFGVRCIQDDSEGERVVGDDHMIQY